MIFKDLVDFCLVIDTFLAAVLVIIWIIYLIIYISRFFHKPKNKVMYVLVHYSDGLECTFFKDIKSADIEMRTQYYLTISDNIEPCDDISKIIPNEFAILSDDDDNIHVWEIFKIPEEVM